MSEMQKAKLLRETEHTYSRRGTVGIANGLDTQEDANDVAQALRDASASKSAAPVIWDLRRSYQRLRAIAILSTAAVVTVLLLVMLSPDQLTGAKLYAALGIMGIATTAAIVAALRSRAIRLQDAQQPSVIDANQVEQAGIFVRVFGAINAFDSAGTLLLALAGGLDAALAGWIIATGLANDMPLISIFIAAALVALSFVITTRWVLSKFVNACGSIRAKRWVRHLARVDLARFPEKRAELAYVMEKLGPLTDDNFSEPTMRDYAVAGGLLLLIPGLFGILLGFRVWIANHDGAADFAVVLGVSAVCAIIGTLAAGLAAMSHLLPEEGAAKTALHRRFPTPDLYTDWLAAHTRQCQRWANEVAGRINCELKKREGRLDHRYARSGIIVPRPFPNYGREDTTPTPGSSATSTMYCEPANEPNASGDKEVA